MPTPELTKTNVFNVVEMSAGELLSSELTILDAFVTVLLEYQSMIQEKHSLISRNTLDIDVACSTMQVSCGIDGQATARPRVTDQSGISLISIGSR